MRGNVTGYSILSLAFQTYFCETVQDRAVSKTGTQISLFLSTFSRVLQIISYRGLTIVS